MPKSKKSDNLKEYKINILGIDYTVVINLNDMDDFGLCDSNLKTIIINGDKKLPRSYKFTILMHEIIHALLDELHLFDDVIKIMDKKRF